MDTHVRGAVFLSLVLAVACSGSPDPAPALTMSNSRPFDGGGGEEVDPDSGRVTPPPNDAAPEASAPEDAGGDTGAPPDPTVRVGFPTIDYPHNDIAYAELNETDCWNSCVANPQCVGISIGTGEAANKCWTKTRIALAETAPLRTTFVRQTHPLAKYGAKVGIGAGGAIATSTADAEDCAKACDANASCVGFVVKRATKECTLYAAIASGTACADCIRYCNPSRGLCP